MGWCNSGNLTIRPNTKHTTYNIFRGKPKLRDGEVVEPVLSKIEREEKELLEFLLREDNDES